MARARAGRWQELRAEGLDVVGVVGVGVCHSLPDIVSALTY